MTLHEWVRQLEEQETPVFRQTALEVAEIAADPESGADSLVRLIGRDPLLTTKVLKLSNSAFYNPSGRAIQNIGRALLLLGMERIRTICLSVALVESMQAGKRLHRVRRELARSLLAAVLSRTIAQEVPEGALDEIFVSALLRRIGPLLFWCMGGDEATALDAIVREGQDDPASEKAILGFQLAQISLLLAEDWKLSKLLVEILRGRTAMGPARSVVLGWEVAASLSAGWGSLSAREGVGRVAEFLDLDIPRASQIVARATRDARTWAQEIGADEVCAFLPEPPAAGRELDDLFVETEPGTVPATPDAIRVPRLAQCLGKLADLATTADLPRLPEIVLDGLHTGLGMDRALYAAYQAPSGELRCRAAVGEGSDALLQAWRFTQQMQMADSLSRSLERNMPLLFDPAGTARAPSLPESLEPFLRGAAFVFLPLRIQGRVMGVFCADRSPSRRTLDTASIEGFKMLCEAVHEALARVRPG